MTTLADKLVEAGARAMTPYAWDDAFWRAPRGGDRHQNAVKEIARSNTRAVLLAVLPMVAEEIDAAVAGEIGPPETMPNILVNYGVANANWAAKARVTALLADLAREG